MFTAQPAPFLHRQYWLSFLMANRFGVLPSFPPFTAAQKPAVIALPQPPVGNSRRYLILWFPEPSPKEFEIDINGL